MYSAESGCELKWAALSLYVSAKAGGWRWFEIVDDNWIEWSHIKKIRYEFKQYATMKWEPDAARGEAYVCFLITPPPPHSPRIK